jgi:hypothetical protein
MSFILKLLLGVQSYLTTWRFNPIDKNTDVTLSADHRTISLSVSSSFPLGARANGYPVTPGKWYVEMTAVAVAGATDSVGVGDLTQSTGITVGSGAGSCGYSADGSILLNGSSVATYATFTTGDVISFAINATLNKIWFAKNGVWQSGNPATGTGGISLTALTYYPMAVMNTGGSWSIPLTPTYPAPGGFTVR